MQWSWIFFIFQFCIRHHKSANMEFCPTWRYRWWNELSKSIRLDKVFCVYNFWRRDNWKYGFGASWYLYTGASWNLILNCILRGILRDTCIGLQDQHCSDVRKPRGNLISKKLERYLNFSAEWRQRIQNVIFSCAKTTLNVFRFKCELDP